MCQRRISSSLRFMSFPFRSKNSLDVRFTMMCVPFRTEIKLIRMEVVEWQIIACQLVFGAITSSLYKSVPTHIYGRDNVESFIEPEIWHLMVEITANYWGEGTWKTKGRAEKCSDFRMVFVPMWTRPDFGGRFSNSVSHDNNRYQ